MNRGRPRKLTDAQTEYIRAWHQARMALERPTALRKRFGISSSSLSLVTRGLTYKVRSQ